MAGQYEVLPCPFCEKGQITCLYFPSVISVKRTTVGSNRSNTPRKSSEAWIIQSGCSVCGKSADEVEKELKRKEII